jgi:uncharacterized iron-regulated membrane protein
MASGARRIWFSVHSWLGLSCGLLLFIVCWSGTIAVLSHEIDWLLDDRISAQPTPDSLKWQPIEDAVKARYPGWRITEISVPLHDGFAVEVLAEPVADNPHRIYVDPASAKVLGHTSYLNVQRFFRSFHMALFDTGNLSLFGVTLGYLLVVLLAFPLLASMITSLVFYKRWWRGFLTLTIGRGPKAFWSSAHKMIGVWSLWLVFVIGTTGVWYLAEWYIPYPEEPQTQTIVPASPPLTLDQLVEKAKVNYPALRVKGISNWENANTMWLDGHDGSLLVRDRAASIGIDRYTGAIVEIRKPGDLSALDRWAETADVIHFGTWGGLASKILYFVFGLLLSALVLTGAYLHVKRQERQHGPKRMRGAVLAAYAATLGIIGYAIWGGYHEIRDYGLNGQFPVVAWPTQAFLIGWCVVTLGILSVWVAKLR